MTDSRGSPDWVGESIFDVSGNEIGKVRGVHPGKHSTPWSFAIIRTTLGHDTALPLKHGVHDIDRLRVPYSAQIVNNAPSLKDKDELTPEFRRSVTQYYRMYFGELPGDPEVPYEPDEEPERGNPESGM
jgi:hypothetical protein